MKRKFLLLVMMCLLGGLSSSLLAQDVTIGNLSSTSSIFTSANYPFCNTYTYSLTQQIYSPDVIKSYNNGESPEGKITSIKYYIAETSQTYFSNVRVYMRNSDVTSFPGKTDWDKNFTENDLYFKGNVDVANDNTIEIVFNQDREFTYDPTKNLIIYVDVESKNGTVATKFKYTSKDGNDANIPYKSLLYHRNQSRNGGLADNGLGDYGWGTASGSSYAYLNVVTLTFSSGGSSTPTAPADPIFTDTHAYPNGQYATSIFNPYFSFYATNKTHYKILLSTTEDFTDERYIAGDENTWVEDKTEQIYTSTVKDLNYAQATTYYWKVIAKNVKDNLESNTVVSTVYSFTTKQISAPGAIEDAYPNGHQNLQNPNFTWTFGTDTEEYQVLIDGEVVKDWTNPGSATTGEYQTSGLSAGEHTWRIDARNFLGTTTGTEYSFSVASLPDNVTPVSPVDGAQNVTSKTIKWKFAKGTTDYRMLVHYGNDKWGWDNGWEYEVGNSTTWIPTEGAEEAEFTISDDYFVSGKTYYWAVDVKNALGQRTIYNGGEEIAIYSFTVSSTMPVTNTAPANGAANLDNPELSWNFKGEATHYQVYIGTSENNLVGKGWMERATEGTGLVPNGSFTTSNLEENTTYFWRVDVKDANGNVYEGETWSFTSKLPVPQNVTANPAQVKPTFSTFGATQIRWNRMDGVQGYDVYLGTQKLNAEIIPANKNYYDIEANLNSMILGYNMNPGHSIYVYAVYESGESMSEAVIVKVTGKGLLDATVIEDINEDEVAGATITLTQTKDEFGNVYEENGMTYTFTTNESGNLSIGESAGEQVLNGTYTINVTKENYIFEGAEPVEITNNATTEVKLVISPNIPGDVTPVTPVNEATNVTSKTIKFAFAEGTEAYRFLYGETDKLLGEQGKQSMGYYINGKTDNTATWVETNGATEAEVEIPYISAGKTHYWAIEVKNAVGQRLFFGATNVLYKDVAVYSFTANETLPVVNTAPANGATNLDNPELSWKYNGNATRYMVRLGESEDALSPYPDGDWKTRGEEETGSLETGSLNKRTKYYWRVDVKDANEVVYEGETWSFVSTLPAPVAKANPEQIVPSASMTYGETTISWEDLEGVQGYNVYLGTEKLNTEILSAETTEYTIAANTLKLTYNMENGYDIYVEAVYELGNSMSEAVNVKVTGAGFLNAKIVKDFNTELGVDGATITLTQLEDEFGNVYEKNGAKDTLTTDYNGKIENQRVFNGKYAVEVSRDYYETYKDTIEFKQGETTNLDVTLVADPANVFEVSTNKNTFNSINVYLDNSNWKEAPAGRYNVYLKNGEEVTEIGSKDFIATNNAITSVYFTYTGWADLSKGSYQFGVAKVEDQINWSEAVTRNYDIFDGEDSDWNNPESWKDGVVPSNDANVHIFGSVIIKDDDDVTVATVTIEEDGKLTINGSLTANEVVNNAKAEDLIINDGAQLRQTGNADLSGIFNMNVVNWTNAEEGWQFISSPFANAKVEALTNSGNYDFYRYDGEAELEWINHREGDFETVFTSGVGYLASHETLKMVTLSGTLNNAVSHTWELTYNEGKDLANFHLLGNPFTFNMDMSAATYKNLVEGVAIVNAEGGYTYVGADQETTTIPVGDGFFVKANVENATDAIALSYGTRSSREKSANINLVATSKAGKDNVVISFSGKKEGFDKLQNFNEEIATICVAENGKAYGIYNCESDVNEIAVMFSAKQMDSYSLSFELNGEFESAVLVDRLTGIETDMTTESEYNFIATSDDMKNRFVVRLGDGQATTANSQFVYQSGDELIIDAEGAIEIIDMMGRVVYRSEMNDGRVNVSEFNNAAYVVRALTAGKVQKVVIY